ncbi:unnamed protein product [Rangifer tarandus platyrhynchus]|uniref:Uncharacterized protein n=1 Tax=Rangifer tarandus platyrhynchus TaxID=3082113 RepID=A0AC59YCQ3_RANTA
MQHDFVFPSLIRGRIKFSTPLNLSMSWDCIKQQNTVGGGKEPACQCRRPKRRGVDPWVGEISWRRARQPTPEPGESHGQGSLAAYSPWGHKDSDTTEWLTYTHTPCTSQQAFHFCSFFLISVSAMPFHCSCTQIRL